MQQTDKEALISHFFLYLIVLNPPGKWAVICDGLRLHCDVMLPMHDQVSSVLTLPNIPVSHPPKLFP